MKARIKKTGEIINLAEYAKIELDVCDSFGNPIELKPEDVELIQEKTDNTDWNQVRIQAAIAAMRALRSNTGYNQFSDVEIAKYSVNYANALIKELKKEQE